MSLPILLDCTLRDGGYYTAWDFDKTLVDEYIKATNQLPINYIEVGYRNNPQKEYLGKYGYCPVFELEDIRKKSTKQISVMLNEKDVKPADLSLLIQPIAGLVDLIRIAVDPKNIDRALVLAKEIKEYGFSVGCNVMYMSKWQEYDGFYEKLAALNGTIDIVNLVDSFGGVSPEEVKDTMKHVKEAMAGGELIGFHGHDNLELGFANTITAINKGIDCVDSTILGMGRGAGNLKTELLLTYLSKHHGLEVNFNTLSDVLMVFYALWEKYQWGTNLPYMISGAYSLPQKEVMELVENRRYSFNSIVRALDNKKERVFDNAKYPVLTIGKFDTALIIGGGMTSVSHLEGIKTFIARQKSIVVIHVTARNAPYYADVDVPQYCCLVGSEGNRFNTLFANKIFKGACILPPYPRKMGTNVPDCMKNATYELSNIEFVEQYKDLNTAVALQITSLCKAKEVYTIGYDGYSGIVISEKERLSMEENNYVFSLYKSFYHKKIIALTPTLYNELNTKSLYLYV